MKGTTVYIMTETVTGYDPFGAPIVTTEKTAVDDCLVGTPSSDDVADALNLYGKKVAYVVGIPKGDTHTWDDQIVEIWGDLYRTIGYPMTGEQANIPLRWGKNIKVERYGNEGAVST